MTVAMVRKGPLGLGFRHQLLKGNMQSNIHRITAATVEALTLFLKRQFRVLCGIEIRFRR